MINHLQIVDCWSHFLYDNLVGTKTRVHTRGESLMNFMKLFLVTAMLATLCSTLALAQDQDIFNAEMLDDGTLLIQHLNSCHNCCVYLGHETEVVEWTIFLKELEVYAPGCWCTCYFDVEAHITDLPQGNYSIEYTYDADESLSGQSWETEIFTVEVPGVGSPTEDPSFDFNQSECHGGGSVDDEQIQWDKVKSFYR